MTAWTAVSISVMSASQPAYTIVSIPNVYCSPSSRSFDCLQRHCRHKCRFRFRKIIDHDAAVLRTIPERFSEGRHVNRSGRVLSLIGSTTCLATHAASVRDPPPSRSSHFLRSPAESERHIPSASPVKALRLEPRASSESLASPIRWLPSRAVFQRWGGAFLRAPAVRSRTYNRNPCSQPRLRSSRWEETQSA